LRLLEHNTTQRRHGQVSGRIGGLCQGGECPPVVAGASDAAGSPMIAILAERGFQVTAAAARLERAMSRKSIADARDQRARQVFADPAKSLKKRSWTCGANAIG
jgi:hypothetical protein